MLQWSPIFQPSDLLSDFQLVHEYDIIYLVHVNDRGNVGTGVTVMVPGNTNYLSLDDETLALNGCNEYEFIVQAVVNDELFSENSSIVRGNISIGKCYRS